jgi:hypothetical protein
MKATRPAETLDSLRYVFGQGPEKALLAGLILAEIALGSMLVAGVARKWAFLLTAALSACFLLWSGLLWAFDAPVGCGCGAPAVFKIAATNRWASISLSTTILLVSIAACRMLRRDDEVSVGQEFSHASEHS